MDRVFVLYFTAVDGQNVCIVFYNCRWTECVVHVFHSCRWTKCIEFHSCRWTECLYFTAVDGQNILYFTAVGGQNVCIVFYSYKLKFPLQHSRHLCSSADLDTFKSKWPKFCDVTCWSRLKDITVCIYRKGQTSGLMTFFIVVIFTTICHSVWQW